MIEGFETVDDAVGHGAECGIDRPGGARKIEETRRAEPHRSRPDGKRRGRGGERARPEVEVRRLGVRVRSPRGIPDPLRGSGDVGIDVTAARLRGAQELERGVVELAEERLSIRPGRQIVKDTCREAPVVDVVALPIGAALAGWIEQRRAPRRQAVVAKAHVQTKIGLNGPEFLTCVYGQIDRHAAVLLLPCPLGRARVHEGLHEARMRELIRYLFPDVALVESIRRLTLQDRCCGHREGRTFAGR